MFSFYAGQSWWLDCLFFTTLTPQKHFQRDCNLSCYPRGQTRLPTGLATAVKRSSFSETQSNQAQEVLGESTGGGPRHDREVFWIRPDRLPHAKHKDKSETLNLCSHTIKKKPKPCHLFTQFLHSKQNRWVKEFVKIMHNPKFVVMDWSNIRLHIRKKANKLLPPNQAKVLTSTTITDFRRTS